MIRFDTTDDPVIIASRLLWLFVVSFYVKLPMESKLAQVALFVHDKWRIIYFPFLFPISSFVALFILLASCLPFSSLLSTFLSFPFISFLHSLLSFSFVCFFSNSSFSFFHFFSFPLLLFSILFQSWFHSVCTLLSFVLFYSHLLLFLP